ncbi:MAG: SprT family zinc-dependent metalloprotease [Planctomycetaceae bacterium]|nr:SprT family zinc-dependent metalloprotease [Planctomycetaceae bacterium]
MFPPLHNWIQFACHQNEVAELAQAIQIEWNRRFTRRLGDAIFNPITFQSTIRLSIPLWPIASEQDRMETVVHEACHLIVWHKFNQFIKPHGPEWRQAMENCGVQPLRTHEVDRTSLARRQRLFILKDCPNEHQCRMSVREFNQIQRGAVMECQKCGLVVGREAAVELDNGCYTRPLSVSPR